LRKRSPRWGAVVLEQINKIFVKSEKGARDGANFEGKNWITGQTGSKRRGNERFGDGERSVATPDYPAGSKEQPLSPGRLV
jgi:hypothetical protein